MHSAGIGGGGFMVIYSKAKREVKVYDYREAAPGKANETMYVNSSLDSKLGNVLKLAVKVGWMHVCNGQCA